MEADLPPTRRPALSEPIGGVCQFFKVKAEAIPRRRESKARGGLAGPGKGHDGDLEGRDQVTDKATDAAGPRDKKRRKKKKTSLSSSFKTSSANNSNG